MSDLKFQKRLMRGYMRLNNPTGIISDIMTIISSYYDYTNVIPVLIKCLTSKSLTVNEIVIYELMPLARQLKKINSNNLLRKGITENLLTLIQSINIENQQKNQLNLLRNCSKIMIYLYPIADWQHIKLILRALSLLLKSNDFEILFYCCYSFSDLSDTKINEKQWQMHIEEIVQLNVIKRLVNLLTHNKSAIQFRSLTTICNILTGNDKHTEVLLNFNIYQIFTMIFTNNFLYKKIVINCGVLSKFNCILRNDKVTEEIKKEICWGISNITAGTEEQIQYVFDENLFEILIKFVDDEVFIIAREAVWAISNATTAGNDKQIKLLVEMGCIPRLCKLLECYDDRTVLVCLQGIQNILQSGERYKMLNLNGINPFVDLVEQCGGLDKVKYFSFVCRAEIVCKFV